MSTFEVLVLPVDDVRDHENADRLSVIRIRGYEAITAKTDSGEHAFQKGELIVYVPEAAEIPESLVKEKGYWNVEKDVGMLSGKNGCRVKAIRLRSALSQGLVWKLRPGTFMGEKMLYIDNARNALAVREGDNVIDFLNITKYEPPIPTNMSGQVAALHPFSFSFDVENYQNFPGFLDNDEVEASEKLHGTFCRISYLPEMNDDRLFGGNVAIASKGLGAKGIVFVDTEENRVGNLYARTAVQLDLIDKLRRYADIAFPGKNVHLLGEVFGTGVQDLAYGETKPTFRAFDLAVCDARNVDAPIYLYGDAKEKAFADIGVERAPVVYRGPWNLEALIAVRDGKTTLNGGKCIREGVVVTAVADQAKREVLGHRLRPMLKLISPAYLLRKGETTEFQ